ncbi:hypothetical protein [Moritella marina]|uniref:hypothetical protein n=1 Tax=Moritella marina TaxID=90736 RepID=UPI0037047EC0
MSVEKQQTRQVDKDSSQNAFFSACANKVLDLTGWYCEPIPAKYNKAVIAYAPHTSNWDFPLLIGRAIREQSKCAMGGVNLRCSVGHLKVH